MTSCIIHEFLTANLFRQLVEHVAQRQGLLKSADREGAGVRALEEFGALRDLLVEAVLDALPDVVPRCGLAPFEPGGVEMRVLARGNAPEAALHETIAADRVLGFVLFVHREPRQFEGGALHLRYPAVESIIEPSQNSIVFFRGSTAMQIGAIRAASGALIDSRLTLEGWVQALPAP